MSKELVVSSTPHETRVAIVEDDRLSEIYVERATEHAIAGGIYKGRVNRVLPGMQSAFVKIGLERDAFLYVTDIVDETEHLESGERDDEDEILLDPKTPSAEKSAPEPPNGEDQEGEADSADGDRRRRRGRRSRRRKGRGASGLPEAKFADLDAQPAAESAEGTDTDDDDASPESFELLPGESLAKYESENETLRTDMKTLLADRDAKFDQVVQLSNDLNAAKSEFTSMSPGQLTGSPSFSSKLFCRSTIPSSMRPSARASRAAHIMPIATASPCRKRS